MTAISHKSEIYEFLDTTLRKVRYQKCTKKEKGIVRKYLLIITGYSSIQLKRLIVKHKKGKLEWSNWQKEDSSRYYTDKDIALLHFVDSTHKLSGKATKKILEREYKIFKKEKYRRIMNISVSHIYNLRKTKTYLRMGKNFEETKFSDVPIGVRTKPDPEGRPGFFRVDSVHQGDYEKQKGVYFVNLVDEVLQMEFVFCVHSICAENIKSILLALMKICPYNIINFHSDNGSEFINKLIADILNKEHIKQTKSRPRKHNDNALVESKNGSIIRKMFGYFHIPATKENAFKITTFCINFFIPYLNYHRHCAFSQTITDKKGKEKKKYPYKNYCTPYEKLKSLPNTQQYLKKGISFEKLDKIAYEISDTDFAKIMNLEKKKLFSYLSLKPDVG